MPLDQASISIAYAPYTLASGSPHIQNFIYWVFMCFVKLNFQRAKFSGRIKPDNHRYIALLAFFHLIILQNTRLDELYGHPEH